MLLRRHHPRADDESPEITENAPAPAPGRSALKAEWIAYAVERGLDQDAAEQLTREQLIEQYGG
ncbi:hypothetical protein ACIBAC_15165 [Streptomyces sp. NPDC051362]|uniref:hypothetical protein n=1 Tax=Streptomyces sp. NPDC051362 TaxID=3365651 RepID=UPI0037958F9D